MKHVYWKVLAACLAAILLLLAVSCHSDEQTDIPPDSTQEEDIPASTTPDVPDEIQLSDAFVVIRPDERSEDEVKAAQMLWRVLGTLYDGKFRLETDYLDKNAAASGGNEFEILIGETNREPTQALLSELTYRDWSYRVVSPNRIVICGGNPAATLQATAAFLRDMFGYEEDAQTGEIISAGSAAALKVGSAFDYRHQYEVTSFRLGRHALSEYTLVPSNQNGSAEAVQQIVNHFTSLTGTEIPVMSLATYRRGEGGPAIFFGCADEEDSHVIAKPYSSDRYYILEDLDNIVIDFKSADVAMCAAARFIKECTPADANPSVAVSFPSELHITGLYIPKGTNSLDLDSIETTEVAPGVVYEERLYYDPNGKPVRAYMITVEKGAASIATALPGDNAKIGTYATVLDQVIAAAEHGKRVVAGINADFFGNTMEGLCVREGVLLHDVSGRPWFGITQDGTPVLGTAEQFERYRDQLVCGVGGSNVIIDNDYVSHISVDHEFGYTRHPRTAVGIKADGSTVLLVVDGRQSKVSNGAALADLADILGSVGCVDALNLDGGGSSTFVLTDGNGQFTVTNSPSDGSLRDVADGLMVILP